MIKLIHALAHSVAFLCPIQIILFDNIILSFIIPKANWKTIHSCQRRREWRWQRRGQRAKHINSKIFRLLLKKIWLDGRVEEWWVTNVSIFTETLQIIIQTANNSNECLVNWNIHVDKPIQFIQLKWKYHSLFAETTKILRWNICRHIVCARHVCMGVRVRIFICSVHLFYVLLSWTALLLLSV